MNRSIEKLRCEYGNTPLLEEEAEADPIQQFLFWLDQAIEAHVFEPNGMILATVSGTSRPSARAVLLKKVVKGGFYSTGQGLCLVCHR
jgi:pyridoxamine 5'-phosphate oxidase